MKSDQDYIKKELSLLYRNSKQNEVSCSSFTIMDNDILEVRTALLENISWLNKLIKHFVNMSKNSATSCGIYGSSISATFLSMFIIDNIDFFVDNDVNRSGKNHLGRHILKPDEAPKDKIIFLPFRPDIAKNIFNNNLEFNLNLELPPNMNDYKL